MNVIIRPAISSMTIQPGSSAFNIFTASWAIHMAKKTNIIVNGTATDKSILERRKHYRKELKLTGSFVRLVSGKPAGRGDMIVRDLSLTGMKLEVYENLNFSEGDELQVEFHTEL